MLAEGRTVTAPTENTFNNLLTLISQQSRVITHLSLSREAAIAVAAYSARHPLSPRLSVTEVALASPGTKCHHGRDPGTP
ncbi:hypothetical protein GA0115233_12301 [Streptomyces sp. DI166]|nr:hypothetical protein GA0115233_12301 [Streptomyces sp. DI166]